MGERVDPGAIPFVGLTGGMGAGKSTALRLLGELGAATISSDDVVHELYAGDHLRELVVGRWGPGVLGSEGVIDRSAIAQQVFADPAEREWLESVIWPLVGQRIAEFREGAGSGRTRPRAAIVETPLLFEAGMAPLFDATIAVVAPEALRRQRAEQRGHAAVDERDARQLSQDEKAAQADHVVVNDGTAEQLRERLEAVLAAVEVAQNPGG